MKILHITDFHYSNDIKTKDSQIRIIDSFISSLEKTSEIEYVFFTGDLVFKGDEINDFHDVKTIFIDKITKKLNLDITNVIICPGNHDVFRGQELDDINKNINELKNNDSVNDFVTKQSKKSLIASLENLNNYNTFQKEFYSKHIETHNDMLVDDMYSIHIRNIGNKKVAITTINSAWRANDSKTDSGNLLYPTFYLKNSFEKVKHCDFRILLMHHPINDFKYWNAQAIEDIIYKDYHILFSGHTHHKNNTLHLTPNIGIYHCTSSASMDFSNISSIGYSIIDVDVETFDLNINNYHFQSIDEIFYKGKEIKTQIPISIEKQNLNKFRTTVRKRFDEKLEEANKLFLSYKDLKDDNNFLKLFTTPIIKDESQNSPNKEVQPKTYSIDDIKNCMEDNYMLFGKDKSGKSAILYKILLDNLNEYSFNHCLPLYIDCKNITKTTKKLELIDELKNFYEINRHEAQSLSNKYHIRILLDNFKKNESIISNCIEDFLVNNKNVSIITTVSETLLNSFGASDTFNMTFTNVFIHDITRKEIRLLTEKWPNLSDSNKEILLEKIQTVFKQLNIPSNYWTVSLFIWIFEKNSNINLGSNFQLIELYIDNLLDKDNFILSSDYKIDFEDLKNYLAQLSHELIIKHVDTNYQISYKDLVGFTDSYKESNKRFVIEIEEIIGLILDKGIVKKVGSAYTFRLNGVFEYFLGHYMSIDDEFRNLTINDDNFYLSFGNELEICAGLNMYDYNYIKSIFDKTKNIFAPISDRYTNYNMDYYLMEKVKEKLNIDSNISDALKITISSPISIENQDVILEEVSPSNSRTAEVQLKKYYEKIEPNSDNLEKALFILARVFRNSKLRNKETFNNEVFDFILDSTTILGFTLMEEIDENKENYLNNLSENELMRLVTKFIPIVMQTFFYDSLIQTNMEKILLDKIEELKKNPLGNELKLLILYFSLIDMDFKNNEMYITDVLKIIKIPILKNTSLIKLYIYLALKVNGNKSLENKIKSHIRDQELNLNNKKNRGIIEQSISRLQKSKLGKRK